MSLNRSERIREGNLNSHAAIQPKGDPGVYNINEEQKSEHIHTQTKAIQEDAIQWCESKIFTIFNRVTIQAFATRSFADEYAGIQRIETYCWRTGDLLYVWTPSSTKSPIIPIMGDWYAPRTILSKNMPNSMDCLNPIKVVKELVK